MNSEKITVLFENERIRVEEIESCGVASDKDFWYDCPIDEWVTVTAGEATLQLKDCRIALKKGDCYYIKARVVHRVERTSPDCRWLCVYVKG